MNRLDLLQLQAPSPIQAVSFPELENADLNFLIKRDDLRYLSVFQHDTAFGGNKWRKLKYNLLKAKTEQHNQLLTFGGAFSNHIAATAAAGQLFGFHTIGIIRGEAPPTLNPTLRFAERCGMQLHFISRTAYRAKNTSSFKKELKEKFGSFYFIPEGGSNMEALKGCQELVEEVEQQLPQLPDYLCLSCGTGGTLAGIVQALSGRSFALGFG